MTPRKRLYLVAATLLGGAVLVLSGLLLMAVHAAGWNAVVAAWQTIRPAVMGAKIAAMIMIVWRWPAIADWAGERFELPQEDRERLRRARWRLAGAFALLELTLGQNLLGTLAS